MSELEKWAARATKTDEIWLLESRNGVNLYLLKDRKSYNDPFGKLPLYAIWKNDKMVYIRPGYRAGYDRFCAEARV